MHNLMQSKAMAKALRQALAERRIELSHSQCLELVARQFGLSDWNTLAARIQAASPQGRVLPSAEGWFKTGNTDTARYRMGLDPSLPGTALIECFDTEDDDGKPRIDQFACMMQSILADDYRGGRVRLTASIRTQAAGLGTIWLRIDGEPGHVLRFDNMMERKSSGPISDTTGWSERSIVLEVPQEAVSIHYGFFLKGRGRTWARDFRIDPVGDEVATTEIPPKPLTRHYLPRPSNLDFSKPAE